MLSGYNMWEKILDVERLCDYMIQIYNLHMENLKSKQHENVFSVFITESS